MNPPLNEYQLRELLRKLENPKLDFKLYPHAIATTSGAVRQKHWDELVKDILSVLNGNIGYARELGYIIFGAADRLNQDGSRQLISIEDVGFEQRQLLDRINSCCSPALPNIHLYPVTIERSKLWIIAVDPSPHLHETSRVLQTLSGNYPIGTVFIRHGDSIDNARQDEREAIKQEKQALLRESNSVLRAIDQRVAVLEGKREELQLELDKGTRVDESIEINSMLIAINKHISFLKKKRRYERNLARSTNVNGKLYHRYAEIFLSEEMPSEIDEKTLQHPLYSDVLSTAADYLERAIDSGYSTPRVYYWLAKIHDIRGELLSAYDYCCDGVLECNYFVLLQLHMKICHAVIGLYPEYSKEAQGYIEQHKSSLRAIGINIDDWGNKLDE